jgi:hypothetical protein
MSEMCLDRGADRLLLPPISKGCARLAASAGGWHKALYNNKLQMRRPAEPGARQNRRLPIWRMDGGFKGCSTRIRVSDWQPPGSDLGRFGRYI